MSKLVLDILEQNISQRREASGFYHTRQQAKYHHLPQHSAPSVDVFQLHMEAGTKQNTYNVSLADIS